MSSTTLSHMSWVFTDIHAPEAEETISTDGGNATPGTWEFASAPTVTVVNAGVCSFRVHNAATKVISLTLGPDDHVGTILTKGASGLVEAGQALPWAVRLQKCLAIGEAASGPCLVVLDAPATSEISSAQAALAHHGSRIHALKGTSCLLVLAGHPETTYPMISSTGVAYTSMPWFDLCNGAEWGMAVDINTAPSDPMRMLDSLALLLGTCTLHAGPRVSTAPYTLGRLHPEEVFCYATFSENVVPGTPRVSKTRGISAHTSDGKPWSAKVILQEDEFREDEDPVMRHLRVMLSAEHASAIGSAYFHLAALLRDTTPSLVRRAMSDVHRKLVPPHVPPAPSLCRVASMNPGQQHSSW